MAIEDNKYYFGYDKFGRFAIVRKWKMRRYNEENFTDVVEIYTPELFLSGWSDEDNKEATELADMYNISEIPRTLYEAIKTSSIIDTKGWNSVMYTE